MAQHDYVIDNQSFPATRSDLNSLFQAIASNNSGTSAPSTTYANQFWYDTTNNKFYIRNEDNDAWIELFVLDQTGDHLEKIGNTITLDGTGNMSLAGDLTVDTDTLFVDASADAVGVNKSAPAMAMDIVGANNSQLRIDSSDANDTTFFLDYNGGGSTNRIRVRNAAGDLAFNVSNTVEAMRIDSSGNVGIGKTPEAWASGFTALQVGGLMSIYSQDGETASNAFQIQQNAYYDGSWKYMINDETSRYAQVDGTHRWYSAGAGAADTAITWSERMRIDSSGNLLVGKTSNDFSVAGAIIRSDGDTLLTRAGTVLTVRRNTSDGVLVDFRKDGTTVGMIGSRGGDFLYIGDDQDAGLCFRGDLDAILPYNPSTNDNRDNAIDLGFSSVRFDDIFATNGTIQTSDQNEKQQIASLTDAEMTAAKAISKLFKTFKWKDKVTSKGDNARTHSGVIAQEVQTAMTDAGLDATKYAFFCSDTWWETQTEVPAVEAVEAVDAVYEDVVIEAVLDDEGNEVEPERTEQRLVSEAVEAVEAQDAYTRTDTYDTVEEAPEGATERTRLGIRYPELLAFVGAATEQRLADIETRLTALEA